MNGRGVARSGAVANTAGHCCLETRGRRLPLLLPLAGNEVLTFTIMLLSWSHSATIVSY